LVRILNHDELSQKRWTIDAEDDSFYHAFDDGTLLSRLIMAIQKTPVEGIHYKYQGDPDLNDY